MKKESDSSELEEEILNSEHLELMKVTSSGHLKELAEKLKFWMLFTMPQIMNWLKPKP